MWRLKGRVWLFGDDVSTELIMPVHARMRPREEQGRYVFEATRPGWSELVAPGDILVAGTNFAFGSGRPVARVLLDIGIAAVVAGSVNGLFLRNAVASGLPVLRLTSAPVGLAERDEVELDLDAWTMHCTRTNDLWAGEPLPPRLAGVIRSGGTLRGLMASGHISSLPGAAHRPAARPTSTSPPRQDL